MAGSMAPSPNNIGRPVEFVYHALLDRDPDGNRLASTCPVCHQGMLLLRRDPETFELLDHDHCILCGQQFVYLDLDHLKGSGYK